MSDFPHTSPSNGQSSTANGAAHVAHGEIRAANGASSAADGFSPLHRGILAPRKQKMNAGCDVVSNLPDKANSPRLLIPWWAR